MTRARTLQFHAVLGDGTQGGLAALGGIGAVDHFRIDAGLDGVQHVASGQVDGRRLVEIKGDSGSVGGDDRANHVRHASAGQIVGFQSTGRDSRIAFAADSRLHGHDFCTERSPGRPPGEKLMAIRLSSFTLALDMNAWNQIDPYLAKTKMARSAKRPRKNNSCNHGEPETFGRGAGQKDGRNLQS